MHWLEYATWGLLGGFAVEALDFAGAIRRNGDWPWRVKGEVGAGPLLTSVVLRVVVGGVVTVAVGAADQISTPFAALAVGVAAPLTVQQISRQIPLRGSGPDNADPESGTGDAR